MTIEKEYEAVVSFANTQIMLAISSTHTHLDHNITLIQGDSQPKENMFQDDAGHPTAGWALPSQAWQSVGTPGVQLMRIWDIFTGRIYI